MGARSIGIWCFAVAAALFVASVAYGDGAATRHMKTREGLVVTYGDGMVAEAEFVLEYVLNDRRNAASLLDPLLVREPDRFLKSAAFRLGLRSTPKIMSDVWGTQIRIAGATFGGSSLYNLVGIDLWAANEYFDRLPADAGFPGTTSLRGKVSPHFELLVNVRERTISYLRTATIGELGLEAEDVHIPVLLRDGASSEELTKEMRDTLVIAGLVHGGSQHETRSICIALHEAVEAAFVRHILKADGRRWIADGVATWVAVAEAKRAGMVGGMSEALDLIWTSPCDGVQIGAKELYAWPNMGRQPEVEHQDCYYRASAQVFEGLASRYGEAFVRKWFKRVQREPYEKRTVETFERTFAAMTMRPLAEVVDEILSENKR